MQTLLSEQERLSFIGMYGHDAKTLLLSSIYSLDLGKDIPVERLQHVGTVLDAMRTLCREDFRPDDLSQENFREVSTLAIDVERSVRRSSVDMTQHIAFDGTVSSSAEVCYVFLHNLLKNTRALNNVSQIRISGAIAPIENILFSYGSQDGTFMKLAVTDDGPGFSSERDVTKYFAQGVSTRPGGGRGLYFVRLMTKFLGGHLGVTTESGRTEIALYQRV